MGLIRWLFGSREEPQTAGQKPATTAQGEHTRAQELMILANRYQMRGKPGDEANAIKHYAEAAAILAKIVLSAPPSVVGGSRNLLDLCLEQPAVRAMYMDLVKQLGQIDALEADQRKTILEGVKHYMQVKQAGEEQMAERLREFLATSFPAALVNRVTKGLLRVGEERRKEGGGPSDQELGYITTLLEDSERRLRDANDA